MYILRELQKPPMHCRTTTTTKAEGREWRSQGGRKGRKLDVPKLLSKYDSKLHILLYSIQNCIFCCIQFKTNSFNKKMEYFPGLPLQKMSTASRHFHREGLPKVVFPSVYTGFYRKSFFGLKNFQKISHIFPFS